MEEISEELLYFLEQILQKEDLSEETNTMRIKLIDKIIRKKSSGVVRRESKRRSILLSGIIRPKTQEWSDEEEEENSSDDQSSHSSSSSLATSSFNVPSNLSISSNEKLQQETKRNLKLESLITKKTKHKVIDLNNHLKTQKLPLFNGFLFKKTKMNTMKKKYCVLLDSKLYVCTHDNQPTPGNFLKTSKVIDFLGYDVKLDFDQKEKSKVKLTLVCPAKKTFHFYCQNAEEAENWWKNIELRAKLRYAKEIEWQEMISSQLENNMEQEKVINQSRNSISVFSNIVPSSLETTSVRNTESSSVFTAANINTDLKINNNSKLLTNKVTDKNNEFVNNDDYSKISHNNYSKTSKDEYSSNNNDEYSKTSNKDYCKNCNDNSLVYASVSEILLDQPTKMNLNQYVENKKNKKKLNTIDVKFNNINNDNNINDNINDPKKSKISSFFNKVKNIKKNKKDEEEFETKDPATKCDSDASLEGNQAKEYVLSSDHQLKSTDQQKQKQQKPNQLPSYSAVVKDTLYDEIRNISLYDTLNFNFVKNRNHELVEIGVSPDSPSNPPDLPAFSAPQTPDFTKVLMSINECSYLDPVPVRNLLLKEKLKTDYNESQYANSQYLKEIRRKSALDPPTGNLKPLPSPPSSTKQTHFISLDNSSSQATTTENVLSKSNSLNLPSSLWLSSSQTSIESTNQSTQDHNSNSLTVKTIDPSSQIKTEEINLINKPKVKKETTSTQPLSSTSELINKFTKAFINETSKENNLCCFGNSESLNSFQKRYSDTTVIKNCIVLEKIKIFENVKRFSPSERNLSTEKSNK